MTAGVPQKSLSQILKLPEGEAEPVFSCSAVSPGKLLRAFQHMHRTTLFPQKGYFVIYGDRGNCTTHIGLVCDVQFLDNGKYRLTTIEGNMSNTVRMYVADYEPVDVFHEQKRSPKTSNLSAVPEAEQEGETGKARTYDLRYKGKNKKKPWYITCFLMTWIPEEGAAE